MREQNRDHQKRFFSVCIERSRPSPTLRPPPPSPAPQPPSPFPSCAESSLSSSSNSSSWSRRRYGASRESSGGSRAGGPGRPPASEASSSAAENSDGERGRRFRRQDHRHRSRSRSRTGSRSRAGSRAGSRSSSRSPRGRGQVDHDLGLFLRDAGGQLPERRHKLLHGHVLPPDPELLKGVALSSAAPCPGPLSACMPEVFLGAASCSVN